MGMTNLTKQHGVSLGADTPDEEGLSKDQIFELLKNRRRRDVLEYLMSVDRTATLSELAEHIAAWENDVEVEALSSSQRKRVYVALYQTHLPKMDKAGIVDYNQDRGKITLSKNAAVLETYLDRTDDGDTWNRRYVALSAASALGVVTVAVNNVGGFTELGLSLFVVTAFLITSLAHTYEKQRANADSAGRPDD